MTKQAKQVQVIERTERTNGYTTYIVASSTRKDRYCVTLRYGKATHCTCPSRCQCYHMTGCEELEEKELSKAMRKIFKPVRRSAVRSDVVAALSAKVTRKIGIADLRKAFAPEVSVLELPKAA